MKSGEKRFFAESEYETCVLCGKSTGILRSASVQSRADYVEGGGQLCQECARRVYGNAKAEANAKQS